MSKLNKVVNDKDLNGFEISMRGTTAYAGVRFGRTGYQHDHEVYVAVIGLSDEEQQIAGKSTFMWHLSKHDSLLDAAYAVKVFNEDRESNIASLFGAKTGDWDCGPIPEFEYEAFDTPEHKARRVAMKTRKGLSVKKLVEIITDDRLIDTKGSRTTMSRRYGSDVFLKLGRKFGNKVVNNDIHTLTINEFELRYGLNQ